MNCVDCNNSTGALVDGLCVYCALLGVTETVLGVDGGAKIKLRPAEAEVLPSRQKVAKLEAKVGELTAENERLMKRLEYTGLLKEQAKQAVSAERERIAKMLERHSDALMHITTEGSTNRLAQEACAVALQKAAEAIRRGE